jgi:hypothetical protein
MLGLNEYDADAVEDGLRRLTRHLAGWHQDSMDGWLGVHC